MSKIVFEDKSFIECTKQNKPGGMIQITIAARDQFNNLKKTTNTVEISMEQFKELISDVQA